MVGTGSYYRKGNTETRRNGWEEREKRTGMEEMREGESTKTWKGSTSYSATLTVRRH